jgi:cell division protein FtsX
MDWVDRLFMVVTVTGMVGAAVSIILIILI